MYMWGEKKYPDILWGIQNEDVSRLIWDEEASRMCLGIYYEGVSIFNCGGATGD